MDLKAKNVLVTGGSSGIGKETARIAAEKGASVAVTGRDVEKLERAAREIGATAIPADVSTDEGVDKTFEEFSKKIGRLDVLVNNAGIGRRRPVEELTRDDFREVFEINVYGAAMMAAKAAQLFKEQEYGNIVNIGSTASLKGYPGGSVYTASKFALRAMSQCWQAELRPFNVRVIHVNPSEVTTAFGRPDREKRPDEPKKLTSTEIAHVVISALEMDDRGFIPEVTVWATNPF